MRDLSAAISSALLVVLLVGGMARGQGSADVDYYSRYYGRYVSHLSGGTLSVVLSETPNNFTQRGCQTGDTVCGHWEGVATVRVSDLDLRSIEIQQGCCDAFGLTSTEGFGMLLPCAGGARCVSQNGHFTGYEPPSNGIGSDYSIVVSCNSSTECSNFLDALRGRQKPSPPPVRVETPPQSSPPSVPARAANPSDFHDALNRIPWRNGGTKDLDDLVKNAIPAQNPQRPPSPQLRYAAFAQSAGFGANGEVGSAIGGDLNGTIGTANVNCVNRAKTSCGDEGYCMLRPGLYGAWATDHKYLGNKAFACNLKTEEEAREQALAWCGANCSVEWSGDAR